MKKKILATLLVAAMTMSMVGCGAAETEEATTDTTETATEETTTEEDPIATLIANTTGTVNIELWCSETEAYQTTMASLVEGFKAEYPDVDFNITIGAVSEGDVMDRLVEDPEAGADVFVFANDQIDTGVSAGVLNPVAATYTYDPNETDSAASIEAASDNGQLYAYPLTASNGYFLYYNSEVISEEDTASWEALTAAASAAGKKVGMDMANGWYLYGFFAGAGCNLSLNDDGSNACDWNSDAGVAAAESIMNIASQDSFISIGDADAQAMVPDGDLVAYVSGTWDSNCFQEAYGDGYAACKLPTFDVNGTATQMGSFSGYKLVGVNAYAENTGWSMLLAEYISNEAAQQAVFEATGEGPANTVAAAAASSPALDALAAQADYAGPQIVGDMFWTPAGSLGASLVEGTDDVKSLLDEAVAGITQAPSTDSAN